MSDKERALAYVQANARNEKRAAMLVALIEAADPVWIEEYGDEIEWVVLRYGPHTAAWNDCDGWDVVDDALAGICEGRRRYDGSELAALVTAAAERAEAG